MPTFAFNSDFLAQSAPFSSTNAFFYSYSKRSIIQFSLRYVEYAFGKHVSINISSTIDGSLLNVMKESVGTQFVHWACAKSKMLPRRCIMDEIKIGRGTCSRNVKNNPTTSKEIEKRTRFKYAILLPLAPNQKSIIKVVHRVRIEMAQCKHIEVTFKRLPEMF